MPGLGEPVGLDDVVQRERPGDGDGERPGIDQLGEPGEVVAVGTHEHVGATQGEHGVGVDHRDDPRATDNLVRGIREGLTADQVQHGVDLAADGRKLLADRAGAVVQHLVRAQLAEPVVRGRAAGRDDRGAECLGDLDGKVTHPARSGVDQHPLIGLDLELLDQTLVGGHAGEGQRGRLLDAE